MTGYLIVLIILIVWYLIVTNQIGDDKKKAFLIGATVIFTFFYGLRAETVGSDTLPYLNMFLKDASQPLESLWTYMWSQKSPAFVLLEWLFFRVMPSTRLWLIFCAAFSFVGLSCFIYKNSEDPFFTWYLFYTIFGLFQMTGVRQSMAMAVLMFAFEYVKERRIVRYLLFIGIAYLFHQSAIVFLPVYWLSRRKVRKIDLVLIVSVIVAMYSYRNVAFNYIKSFTSYYYFEELNHSEPINFSIMIYAAVLGSYIWALFTQNDAKIYSDETCVQDAQEANMYTNIQYLGAVFMPMVAVNGAVRRIVMYFAVYMIFSIPRIIRRFFTKQSVFLVQMILGVLLLILMVRGVSDSSYVYHLCI